MLIKHKLIANTVVLAVGMALLLLLINFSNTSLESDVTVARNIGNIDSSILQLRRNEKDFLARKDLKYVDKFNKKVTVLKSNITQLKTSFNDMGADTNEINGLTSVLQTYHDDFNLVVAAQQRIGLHPKDALYGELRASVHKVEELLGEYDYQLLSSMLQLRRNEKDFMLRLDNKYALKWKENANGFINDVNTSELPTNLKEQIVNSIGNYQAAFENLVTEQSKLGFSANEGLQGKMRASVHKVDDMLKKLVAASIKYVDEHTNFIEGLSYSIFLLILIVAVTISLYMTKSVLVGLEKIRTAINDVATSKNLSIVAQLDTNDELGEIAKNFNDMVATFRNLIVEVNHSVVTLNGATQSLAEGIHATNDGVESQIQQTDLVATAVTEMVATVEQIASNTHDAADKAQKTNENAVKGQEGVNKTIAQIDNLSAKLLESEGVVQELAKDSDTIGSVLDVIRGIAEQTNLLALNAAIEAARAGEQGRGFAVVADEVRTLASRTQDSTQEIESIISSLQSRTKDIVEHMASCRVQGQDSAEQASIAGELLVEITQDVTAIVDMSTEIATAIREQSTVAAEVNVHVVAIRDVAENAGKTAAQNAQMSEELSQQASALNQEVHQFTV